MNLHLSETGKIKVFHLLPPSIGGLRSHVLNLLDLLDRSEYELTVAGPPEFQRFMLGPRCQDIRFHPIELAESVEPFGMVYHTVQLTALLLKEKCTILHAHGLRATLAAGIGGFPADIRISSIYAPVEGILARHFLGMALRAYSHCVGSTPYIREELLIAGYQRERCTTIPTGVTAHQPTDPEIEDTLGQIGIETGLPLIMVMSRYLPNDGKWIQRFVNELRLARNNHTIWFVGDAPGNNAFQSLRRKQPDDPGSLIFTSFPLSIRAAAAASIACIIADPNQSFPLVLPEIMAAGGAVVIAGRKGEAAESIIDGATGLLVETGDPEAFSQATGRLNENPEERKRISELAREQILEQYNASVMVRKTEALYHEIIKHENGSTGVAAV